MTTTTPSQRRGVGHCFRIKLLIAKKWCDWHDSYPLALSFPQATKRASIDSVAKRRVRISRPAKDRPKIFVNVGDAGHCTSRNPAAAALVHVRQVARPVNRPGRYHGRCIRNGSRGC
jgi:hypothetical protein